MINRGAKNVYVETPDERDGFHKMYVMMQKENELMHQEEIVEQLASEEEMEMFNFSLICRKGKVQNVQIYTFFYTF